MRLCICASYVLPLWCKAHPKKLTDYWLTLYSMYFYNIIDLNHNELMLFFSLQSTFKHYHAIDLYFYWYDNILRLADQLNNVQVKVI